MEPGKQPPAERSEELELSPQPRIKKLSSAIVWIAAIFAVAVLWVVGYLVSSKARKPAGDRPYAAGIQHLAQHRVRHQPHHAPVPVRERVNP